MLATLTEESVSGALKDNDRMTGGREGSGVWMVE
jgi:hypothetical protein